MQIECFIGDVILADLCLSCDYHPTYLVIDLYYIFIPTGDRKDAQNNIRAERPPNGCSCKAALAHI